MNGHIDDAGSRRYVEELTAFGAMLTNCPIESAIGAVQMGVAENGSTMFMVYLPTRRLAEGAAALVEWRRTLVRPAGVAERSADGETVRIGVMGKSTESAADVVVWVSNIPYGDLTCVAVEPDGQAVFGLDLLDLWAVDL